VPGQAFTHLLIAMLTMEFVSGTGLSLPRQTDQAENNVERLAVL